MGPHQYFQLPINAHAADDHTLNCAAQLWLHNRSPGEFVKIVLPEPHPQTSEISLCRGVL